MLFTLISECAGDAMVTQNRTTSPEDALRAHVASWPDPLSAELPDEELEWYIAVAEGAETVTLIPVHGCNDVWLWDEGAGREPQAICYVVRAHDAEREG